MRHRLATVFLVTAAFADWMYRKKFSLQEGCQLEGILQPQQASQGGIPFNIKVPVAEVQHWYAPKEAAVLSRNDMSVLCLPHFKSKPAIDAISSPALYWQVSDPLLHHACIGMMRGVEAACTQKGSVPAGACARNCVTASCQCLGALSSLCE